MRKNNELPELTDTDENDVKEILRAQLKKLVDFKLSKGDAGSPKEEMFYGPKRVGLILVIK